MFTQTATLFRTKLRQRYDAEGQTLRHTDAMLLDIINDSYRWLRSSVSDWGYGFYIAATSGTLTGTPAAGETYEEINYPADASGFQAVQVLGVDVFDSPCWRPLEPISFVNRRNYVDRSPVPEAFSIVAPSINQDAGSGSWTTAAGKIRIYPPGGRLAYKIHWLPDFQDAVAGDAFIYQDETWRMLHLWRCIAELCGRDQDDPAREQRALFECNPDAKGSIAARVRSMAPRVQNAGPRTMQRSERYYG